MTRNISTRMVEACFVFALFISVSAPARAEEPLRVCASVTDLGSLVQEIGGDEVSVTVFAKGTEDPHFVEPRPSFIKALSQADLFVLVGMDQELGWAPVLLKNARNARVLPGAQGYLDASRAIEPLEVPAGSVDRSMGDVHVMGNPHYLLDPLNGLAVGALIRDTLAELRPAKKRLFDRRYAEFRRSLGDALVGARLAQKYEFEKLALLAAHGKLREFLQEQGESELLEGWLGAVTPHFGVKAAGDHNLWPYFARRFGVRMIGFLEPKPGIPPTTKHMSWLIERMRAEDAKLILSAAYYDPRHARFVSEQTGAAVARMAHQVGAREGTDRYTDMVDYNVRQITRALAPRS